MTIAAAARALMLLVENLHFAGARGGDPQRERDFIDSVSRLLDSLSDLRELSQRAMRLASTSSGPSADCCCWWMPRAGALNPVVEHGPIDAPRATRRWATAGAVERVPGAEAASRYRRADRPRRDVGERGAPRSALHRVRALFRRGKVVGAVYLDDSRRAHAFSEADRGMLEGFAHLMAVAIEKSRGHEEVQRENEPLVGENLSLRQEAEVRFQPNGSSA